MKPALMGGLGDPDLLSHLWGEWLDYGVFLSQVSRPQKAKPSQQRDEASRLGEARAGYL